MVDVEGVAEVFECGFILASSVDLNDVRWPILDAVLAESFYRIGFANQELSSDVLGEELDDQLPVEGSLDAHRLPCRGVHADCFPQSVLPFWDIWFSFDRLALVFRRMAVLAWNKLVSLDLGEAIYEIKGLSEIILPSTPHGFMNVIEGLEGS